MNSRQRSTTGSWLASGQKWGTPVYLYDANKFSAQCQAVRQAFAGHPTEIFYAVKANSNLAVLSRVFQEGLGADIVSGGEFARTQAVGLNAARVVFSGVGKTNEELRTVVAAGVYAVQIESQGEIDRLEAIAKALGTRVRVGLRINPEIPAATHRHLITAARESKFGIPSAQVDAAMQRVSQAKYLEWVGLSCHLGSQIDTPSTYRAAAENLIERAKAHPTLEFLDVGGGFAVPYRGETMPAFADYAAAILPVFRSTQYKLLLELGRSIVAESGVLITKVIDIKRTEGKTFVVLDAGMNDLIRPALYDAHHEITPLSPRQGNPENLDFVGPVCESSDHLGSERWMPAPEVGDYFCIHHAGAYGASMGSRYNSRPLCAEVLCESGKERVIRARETYTDLFSRESL